ncbi:GPW/gp25 family protein [Candidatus Gracilibacteria bacterium]|jgi:phage baseplate assembly protein W|nr:GPW/gp25 family protein [Candidatus Gracilibacteria bacterium]
MATKLSAEDGNLGVSTLIGTRTKLYKDIDLTFANKPSGEIFKKVDAAAVKQAVKNLILTNYFEKPFQPKFGGNLRDMLFDLADDDAEEDIEDRIKAAITIFEPRAQALNVTAIATPDRNSIRVTAEFRVINTQETVTVTTVLARLR